MPLTHLSVKNANPKDKPYKLADTGGLYLLIKPTGGKLWRYKYYFAGKEKLFAIGSYPDISLADARERNSEARKILADGRDPGEVKQESKRVAKLNSDNSFEAIAREWHTSRSHKWTEKHKKALMRRLEGNVFPQIGNRPIAEITPPHMLSMLRLMESRSALDLAHRMQQICGQIFTYAIATGRAERNPVNDLRGALAPVVKKHHAYLKAEQLPEFMQKLDTYDNPQTKLAIRFMLLTFVRTGELRGAKWSEIDMAKAEWRILAERMKMRDPHIVPLSTQALAVLSELQPISGHLEHVFPNQHKPRGQMSENTILYALYRMGYHGKSTGHGFRATASTILNEHGFAPDVIERQLAHAERNQVRASYNHAQYLPERRKMMQWWGDYLSGSLNHGNWISKESL